MLHIKVPSRLVRTMAIHHKWFAHRPEPADALRFSQYLHCDWRGNVPGFRRSPKFTLLVDLAPPAESILSSFSETTRYEIQRGGRDGAVMQMEPDLDAFCLFMTRAAAAQGRSGPGAAGLRVYGEAMKISKVMLDGRAVAMHAHVVDASSGRALLYLSGSTFRQEADSQVRNRVGRANRWLHYQDMLMFKELGAGIYDMGGYAKDTEDAELRGVNEFKAGFGGRLVELSNYASHINVMWNKLRGGTGAI